MPMNKEERKEYYRLRYIAKREEHLRKQNEYNQLNRDKINQRNTAYRESNEGKKKCRISMWKYYGIIHDDYDALYERYLNTNECEECGIEMCFGKSNDARCVDHDHDTGEVRNILCRKCNSLRK